MPFQKTLTALSVAKFNSKLMIGSVCLSETFKPVKSFKIVQSDAAIFRPDHHNFSLTKSQLRNSKHHHSKENSFEQKRRRWFALKDSVHKSF